MITDKEMKLMIFATGNVRRDEVFKRHSGYKKIQNRIRWGNVEWAVSTVIGLSMLFASSGVDPIECLRLSLVLWFSVCLCIIRIFRSRAIQAINERTNVIIIMGLSVYTT